jgi:hypothetical protein
MISLPTVFIVGAGASAEFGLPTGGAIKEQIARSLNFRRDADGQFLGDSNFHKLLGDRFQGNLDLYTNGGIELSETMEPFESIDEALQWFSSRPEVVTLGKACIVRHILAAERRSVLFHSTTPELTPNKSYPEAWASHLLSMAIGSFKREETEAIFSRLKIINFNYDRTIEHFLFSTLVVQFRLAREEAQRAIANLKIIRPYGVVGPLSWQVANASVAVAFGADLARDHDRLFGLVNNIYTFTEQASGLVKSTIEEAINGAAVIVVLGFGFHQQNMLILRGARVNSRRIFATVCGIDKENHENLARNLSRTFQSNDPIQPQLLDRRCYKLLQTMKLSIMNPM